MKDLENVVVGAITTKMPRNENGDIIDKSLHSDLINAVNEAFALYNVVGRSEQLLCDDCLSDGMDKVLRKENNCLSCTQKIAK